MKINTDGVLLGALAEVSALDKVLDIGTGTGVISLMLAQRFPDAKIDAVEIDSSASATARNNFALSPFSDRLQLIDSSFQEYGKRGDVTKYDLIVTNPPFFLNSLKNPDHQKKLARHAEKGFYEDLIRFVQERLSQKGEFWLILPSEAAFQTRELAKAVGLHLTRIIEVKSFAEDQPHREVLVFSRLMKKKDLATLVIYAAQNSYSEAYRSLLRDFLIIF